MALKGEYTHITYDSEHRIVQLDAFVPELEGDEAFISIDLHEFSLSHPLRGGVSIFQEVDEIEFEDHGYIIPQISTARDRLNYAVGLNETDVAESDITLRINQHIGKLGSEAVAIAISTYDMDQAVVDAIEALGEPEALADMLDDYSSNVN